MHSNSPEPEPTTPDLAGRSDAVIIDLRDFRADISNQDAALYGIERMYEAPEASQTHRTTDEDAGKALEALFRELRSESSPFDRLRKSASALAHNIRDGSIDEVHASQSDMQRALNALPTQKDKKEVITPIELEFTIPKKISKFRNWTRKASIKIYDTTSRVFEKAKQHPVATAGIIGGIALAGAYIGLRYGISRGSSSPNNEVSQQLIENSTTIPVPKTTTTIDRATEWYELYRQNNPGTTREQFNQIVTSEEFAAMCKNPEQFAHYIAIAA